MNDNKDDNKHDTLARTLHRAALLLALVLCALAAVVYFSRSRQTPAKQHNEMGSRSVTHNKLI
jgi:cell division protein FtsL